MLPYTPDYESSDAATLSLHFDLDLVICGMARSGTKYLATVLSNAGIPCTHEQIFRTYNRINLGASRIESSCFAAHHLGNASSRTPIVHLVRNPNDWLESWQSKRVSSTYLNQVLPFDYTWRSSEDPHAAALQAWVTWNLMIEAWSWRRFRVEDLSDLNIVELGELSGHTVSRMKAAQALAETPRNINSAGTSRRLPLYPHPSRELERAHRLAARYGYGAGRLGTAGKESSQ